MKALNGEIDDYAWRMRQLQVATKNKNIERVAQSIDNKYLPEWHENKAMQIARMSVQIDKLKSTKDNLDPEYVRPSNSMAPYPIKLQEMPQIISHKTRQEQHHQRQQEAAGASNTGKSPPKFEFTSEKKLREVGEMARSAKKEARQVAES